MLINDFVKILYDKLDEKLGDDIVVIDFSNTNPLYDYMFIVSALNERLANSLVEEAIKVAREKGQDVINVDKSKDSGWFFVDLNDIIVHIFYDGKREYYDLEGLWKDFGVLKM